jgi:hypothetical protein
MTRPSQSVGVISAAHGVSPIRRMLMPIVHSAVAFVYSALALAETFVLFAVVIGLFALVVRVMIRASQRLTLAMATVRAPCGAGSPQSNSQC